MVKIVLQFDASQRAVKAKSFFNLFIWRPMSRLPQTENTDNNPELKEVYQAASHRGAAPSTSHNPVCAKDVKQSQIAH